MRQGLEAEGAERLRVAHDQRAARAVGAARALAEAVERGDGGRDAQRGRADQRRARRAVRAERAKGHEAEHAGGDEDELPRAREQGVERRDQRGVQRAEHLARGGGGGRGVRRGGLRRLLVRRRAAALDVRRLRAHGLVQARNCMHHARAACRRERRRHLELAEADLGGRVGRDDPRERLVVAREREHHQRRVRVRGHRADRGGVELRVHRHHL
mmetsp:Transcript_767/g.2025  ORF Transcript_767/g.2025 Transcript_767/m.2025 type:complete len:214 (+) Transcript_767:1032-1673(+)